MIAMDCVPGEEVPQHRGQRKRAIRRGSGVEIHVSVSSAEFTLIPGRSSSQIVLMRRACLWMAVAMVGCRETETVRPPPIVMAHYMPWFRAEPMPDGSTRWEHWPWFGKGPKHDPDDVAPDGRRDLASVFYPMIGPYHGADPDVIEYHVRTARAAGIQGFIADWYGPGTYTDDVFGRLAEAADSNDFRVAVCLEEKTFFPNYSKAATREEAQAEMSRQIEHVLQTHARRPSYFRFDGRPVFFLFNNHQDGALGRHVFSPEEIAAVLDRLPEKILLVRGHTEPDYWGTARGAYAWIGDAAYRRQFYETAAEARKEGRLDFVAGVANPGFNDTGVWGWGHGPRVTPRRGIREYEEQWLDAEGESLDLIQVATWNDFNEGSTIEPAVEYGFDFVNLTEQFVGRITGRPVDLSDNDQPLKDFQRKKGAP